MPEQSTAIARRPAAGEAQVAGAIGRIRVSEQQYRRIVCALRNRRPERRIAQEESCEEALVREVRALEYERRDSYIKAVATSVGGLMDALRIGHQEAVTEFTQNVRHLHADIDRGIFEDLQGVA